MARYRVTTRSYINNRLAESGETVENPAGSPGSALVPVDADAEAKAQEAALARRTSRTTGRT